MEDFLEENKHKDYCPRCFCYVHWRRNLDKILKDHDIRPASRADKRKFKKVVQDHNGKFKKCMKKYPKTFQCLIQKHPIDHISLPLSEGIYVSNDENGEKFVHF